MLIMWLMVFLVGHYLIDIKAAFSDLLRDRKHDNAPPKWLHEKLKRKSNALIIL